MTPDQFKYWRKRMDFSQSDAAEFLGLSKGTIGNYEAGERREGGEVTIPKSIELACMAVAMGLNEFVDIETLLELGTKPGASERAKSIAALIEQEDQKVWKGDFMAAQDKIKFLERDKEQLKISARLHAKQIDKIVSDLRERDKFLNEKLDLHEKLLIKLSNAVDKIRE